MSVVPEIDLSSECLIDYDWVAACYQFSQGSQLKSLFPTFSPSFSKFRLMYELQKIIACNILFEPTNPTVLDFRFTLFSGLLTKDILFFWELTSEIEKQVVRIGDLHSRSGIYLSHNSSHAQVVKIIRTISSPIPWWGTLRPSLKLLFIKRPKSVLHNIASLDTSLKQFLRSIQYVGNYRCFDCICRAVLKHAQQHMHVDSNFNVENNIYYLPSEMHPLFDHVTVLARFQVVNFLRLKVKCGQQPAPQYCHTLEKITASLICS